MSDRAMVAVPVLASHLTLPLHIQYLHSQQRIYLSSNSPKRPKPKWLSASSVRKFVARGELCSRRVHSPPSRLELTAYNFAPIVHPGLSRIYLLPKTARTQLLARPIVAPRALALAARPVAFQAVARRAYSATVAPPPMGHPQAGPQPKPKVSTTRVTTTTTGPINLCTC